MIGQSGPLETLKKTANKYNYRHSPQKMINVSPITSILLFSFILIGCESKTNVSVNKAQKIEAPSQSNTTSITHQKENVVTFLNSAQSAFKQLSESSITLHQTITHFINTPTPEHLSKAKNALANTHKQYMMIQVFQNIDIPHPEFDLKQNQDPVIHPLHIRLDQFPLIPGYLDAVPNYPHSGLVFSEQALTLEYLNNEHQFTDTAYVALGFHALEFMLTGGLNQKTQARSTDFNPITKTPEEHTPKYRRSRYLQLLVQQLDEDLQKLASAWQSNEGFYPEVLHELLSSESSRLIQQAFKMEEHTLSSKKEHAKQDLHLEHADERKAQLSLMQAAHEQTLL